MNGQEIIEKLNELGIYGSEFAYELDSHEDLGNAPIIHSEGDREGGGDYSCVVRHFEDHNVYIQVTGYYSSYNGTDWDSEFSEVKPVERTVTFYE